MARRIEGAALLVAGHGATGGGALDVSAVHTIGQIGEALMATDTGWQIRRLSAAAGERHAADRVSLKHHIDELIAEPVRVAVLVMVGVIADTGGPALVTSSQLREYPEDAALPLAWIGSRLRAAKAEQLLVVVSGRRDASLAGPEPRAWLDALATGRPDHVVAAADADTGTPLVDALLAGLCGDALDPRTGTVTMKSISGYLARRVPEAAIQLSDRSQTLASSPPLAGLWDVRRSQLSLLRTRSDKRPAPAADDDLTGTVLPGRFQLASIVARGTFGTVYRARQLAVERDVAVKVLHADIDPSSEDGRLFVHEVRAVGRIDHANVVRIHQADITPDGRLFYAMELLDGRDLQQVVTDGPLAKPRAVELVCQLLAGLGAAHDAGLVHADVKPANAIVVPKDGGERVVLVDFGLARLRAPDKPAESAGGTPAFMAPEQLHESRVDARSDLFSAALVLVNLLTGWRRSTAHMLVPPLDGIEDRQLREVLARALALDPAKRYPTARDFTAALTGAAPLPRPRSQPGPVLPFRLFAALTEADQDRLHGREADVAALTEHVLYRRSVIYTAPSGTGKTSLLRAGLAPRLEALGIHVAFLRTRGSSPAALAAAISPGATSVTDAIAQHAGGKLVLVLDQLEAALADGGDELLAEALGFAHWPADVDVSVVLSIREDHLARLVARAQQLEPGIPIMRLPPLGLAGARTAIVGPLTEARLAIEPDLLDALLADLERAAAALAPELGWGDTAAVYPPHLQLACSVLYDALGPGEATLTLAHYKRLGGFAAIVGEHLERVLDVELAGGRDAIARDLFLALVTTSDERAIRPEAELLAMVGGKHGADQIAAVLEVLRERGLLVRVRGEGEASWELVHDSLVPRVRAWIDRRDLARRKAVELVRYHLRRSTTAAPSLLGRAELRELRPHAGAIADLDAEWRTRTDAAGWSPTTLVARSRQVLRRRALALGSAIVAALAVTSVAVVSYERAEARERAEHSLRDRDLGRFVLELAPFDWDAEHLRAVPVAARELPQLSWELHYPDRADEDAPGELYASHHLSRGEPVPGDGHVYSQHAQARGGRAFLVVTGRGRAGERCAPSIVPLHDLPGYRDRANEAVLHVTVPTCAATHTDMIALAPGPFISAGVGEPPSEDMAHYPAGSVERRIELPAFAIDRTETTNAAFRVFDELRSITGYSKPGYPDSIEFGHASEPDHPAAGVIWVEARAYCRFLGKELPSAEQWDRALRGGARLSDGSLNTMPRRNLPWGRPVDPVPAKLADTGDAGTAAVGSFSGDRSPDGVLDLAGNVSEWTLSSGDPGHRMIRGGNWLETTRENYVEWEAGWNQRPSTSRLFSLGIRCVSAE